MAAVSDIGVPIGLVIIGRAHDDARLLRTVAVMKERGVTERHAPPRTPALRG